MEVAVRTEVRRRASNRCEYCLLPQQASLLTFHVDHIIAKQHLDEVVDEPQFLCLACNRCNLHKGPNLSSIDPQSKQLVSLFHPRSDLWNDHFQIQGGEISGVSPTGRATVRLLDMNAPQRVELREQWIAGEGSF